MPPRDIIEWLREGRAILAGWDGERPAAVRVVIAWADTGRGIEIVLPPADEDGEPRYAPTDAGPRRVILSPDTSLPHLGTVLAGRPGETSSTPATESGLRLRSVHRRLLSAADVTPAKAERICRKAGLSCNSTSRAALAELVRAGHLRHGPDGYRRP
ncbi:MAG: hypothetical protein IT429_00900 [Gemmataceae bacterium]|nr:hypothetical protein [Gemmataceae bacterium]